MAIIILGRMTCPLCGATMEHGQDIVAFPAFLPFDHALGKFSDAAFHQDCFNEEPQRNAVEELYRRHTEIWESRPKDLRSLGEMEAWGREAFKNFP